MSASHPKATVCHENAICRNGPGSDIAARYSISSSARSRMPVGSDYLGGCLSCESPTLRRFRPRRFVNLGSFAGPIRLLLSSRLRRFGGKLA